MLFFFLCTVNAPISYSRLYYSYRLLLRRCYYISNLAAEEGDPVRVSEFYKIHFESSVFFRLKQNISSPKICRHDLRYTLRLRKAIFN